MKEFCTETKTSQQITNCISDLLEDFDRKKPCGMCISFTSDGMCGNWKSCQYDKSVDIFFTCCHFCEN